MSVNYYKTDFGIFTVIADTEVLTRVRTMSGYGYIIEKGVITSFGETVLSTFPELSEVIATIGVVENITDSEAYTNMLTFIPQIRFFVLSDITTEAQTKIYTLSGLKNVQYTYRLTGTHSFLTTSVLGYGTDKFRTATGNLPYGFGDTGQTVNACDIEFLIANDEMSDFMYYRIYINTIRDGEGSASHVNITGDDLSFLVNYFDGLTPYDLDPYSGGGTSGEGGGTGDFDGTSDDIPIPDLPTLSATSTNFITLFNPSLGELQNLANYMWSDLFDLDTFKKIFADPMDCILGLSIVPVAVPSGGSKAVTVGNISTGVTMQVASAQYVSVDCGTLNVNEYWGAYLDYDPYTKAEIYLPYIGTHPIAVDDIMGKAVHVVYHVDILSGACTAYVQCGGSVLYSFIGQCSASIPITGNDWTNVINGVLSIAGSIGSMVATGGMSAPLTALQAPVTAAKVGGALATGSSLASTAVNSLKPSVEKSGSMSGVGGMLAVQTPYIILTRPRQARPKQQNTYTGYPSFITSKLSKLTGYTEIEVIHMDGLSCTDSESVEIESLLKSGVIF